MQNHLFKKITFFALLLCASTIFANSYSVNEKIPTFSLADQFNKKHTVSSDIKTIIVSFEKGTGADINEFLNAQDENFLAKHKAVFIANISGMPSIITKLFALPKMKKYKHKILLIYDENDTRFIHQDDKSTVYHLENGIVKSIEYITKDDLKTLF